MNKNTHIIMAANRNLAATLAKLMHAFFLVKVPFVFMRTCGKTWDLAPGAHAAHGGNVFRGASTRMPSGTHATAASAHYVGASVQAVASKNANKVEVDAVLTRRSTVVSLGASAPSSLRCPGLAGVSAGSPASPG